MDLSRKFSVVVPMYNEADNAEPLITEIATAIEDEFDAEIIVVDDGSSDATWQNLLTLSHSISRLKPIRHKQNKGQSAALVTGIRFARYPWVITLDGDGQNDPADIPEMIRLLAAKSHFHENYLIAGNRRKRKDTWLKRISSRVANNVRSRLLQDDCMDTGCGLKIFPRDIFLRLPHFNHMHRFLPYLFKLYQVPIANIKVNHRPRQSGCSKYGFHDRLWAGIVDIIGVLWLKARNCHVEAEVPERV